MSAYDEAMKAASGALVDEYERGRVLSVCAPVCVDAFLAALPPSIVVDGRVVELKAAHRVLAAEYAVESMETEDELVEDWTVQLANAAREVST